MPAAAPDCVHPAQRLCAAQRLAAGDPAELAAALAGLSFDQLQALREEPDFPALIQACDAVHRLSPQAWRRRMELLARDAAEAALLAGKVSTLNLVLRTDPALVESAAGDEEAAEDAADEAEEATPDLPPAVAALAQDRRLKPLLARCTPEVLELLQALRSSEAYEAWRAKRPLPDDESLPLSAEDQALIRWVTRHNPPWAWGPRPEPGAPEAAAAPASLADPPPTALETTPGDDPAAEPSPPLQPEETVAADPAAAKPRLVWAKEPLPPELEPFRPTFPPPRR